MFFCGPYTDGPIMLRGKVSCCSWSSLRISYCMKTCSSCGCAIHSFPKTWEHVRGPSKTQTGLMGSDLVIVKFGCHFIQDSVDHRGSRHVIYLLKSLVLVQCADSNLLIIVKNIHAAPRVAKSS